MVPGMARRSPPLAHVDRGWASTRLLNHALFANACLVSSNLPACYKSYRKSYSIKTDRFDFKHLPFVGYYGRMKTLYGHLRKCSIYLWPDSRCSVCDTGVLCRCIYWAQSGTLYCTRLYVGHAREER